jgi:hypothetical protein
MHNGTTTFNQKNQRDIKQYHHFHINSLCHVMHIDQERNITRFQLWNCPYTILLEHQISSQQSTHTLSQYMNQIHTLDIYTCFFTIIINYYIYLYLHLPPQIKKLVRLVCNDNFHDISIHIYPLLVIIGGKIEFTLTKMKLVHNTSNWMLPLEQSFALAQPFPVHYKFSIIYQVVIDFQNA